MSKRERIQKAFIYGVFICYMLLLLKILFFSRVTFSELFDSQRAINRSINLIPFSSIMEYLSGSTEFGRRFFFANVAGNIAIFVPLGVYVVLFKKDKRITSNMLYIFAVSFLVETIQGLLGIGVSDIDDLIFNCLGGFIGISGYKLLFYILRDDKRMSDAVAVLSAIGLPFLLYYLFMIRMRF